MTTTSKMKLSVGVLAFTLAAASTAVVERTNTARAASTALLCGSSSNAIGTRLKGRVVTVIEGSDTVSRNILVFPLTPASSVTWVSDEAKCQKAITTLDKLWPTSRGGPVYMMQVGTDYVAVPGDAKSVANFTMVHLSSTFVVLGSPVVWQ